MTTLIIKIILSVLLCTLFTFSVSVTEMLRYLFSQLYLSCLFLTTGPFVPGFSEKMHAYFCCFNWLAMSEICFLVESSYSQEKLILPKLHLFVQTLRFHGWNPCA